MERNDVLIAPENIARQRDFTQRVRTMIDKVPEGYVRKQTTVNGERYITQELKDLEHEILTASERVVALEYQLFTTLRGKIVAQAPRIQRTAAALAEIDALGSLAAVAVRDGYCRPDVDESGVIEITAGRHPVVERVLKDSLFVPNDTFMRRNFHGRIAPCCWRICPCWTLWALPARTLEMRCWCGRFRRIWTRRTLPPRWRSWRKICALAAA